MTKIKALVDRDLREFVPDYLDNRREDLTTIRECLEAGDFDSIRRLAHRMKGSGGGYGFSDITVLGAAMEQAAISKDRGGVEEQAQNLEDYLNGVEIVYV